MEVRFPINVGSKPDHALLGKLVYRASTDIGMYIEQIPPSALEHMTQARHNLPQIEETNNALLPEEKQAVMRDCVNLFRVFIGDVWQKFHAVVKHRVVERDSSPLPLSDHNRFLNSLGELLLDFDTISQRHFDMLTERMNRIGDIQKNEAPTAINELSIVDESSFDDWVNLTKVYNHIESDIRSQMFQFAQRFNLLTPVQISPHNDPFGPQAVCLTFQEVLRSLNFSNEMRAVVYRHFGDLLGADYARLYTELNQVLTSLNPVQSAIAKPKYEHGPGVPLPPRHGPGGTQDRDKTADVEVSRLAEVAEKLFSLYPPLSSAMANAPDSGAAPGLSQGGTTATQGAAATYGNMAWTVPQNTGATPPLPFARDTSFSAGGNYSAPLPQPGTLNGVPISVVAAQGAGGLSAGPRAYTTPLRLALDNVAIHGEAKQARRGALPPETPIQVQTLLSLSNDEGPLQEQASLTDEYSLLLSKPKLAARLPEVLREELGSLTQIMSTAIGQHDAGSDIQILLRKIEKPIYDLALAEDAPPSLGRHPLGRMLNLIDRLAIVADDEGQFLDANFLDLIHSIIDHAVSNGGQDTALIDNACDEIEKLLDHSIRIRRQLVKNHQEDCEARILIRQCHRAVADELNTRLHGHAVPVVVDTLIEQGWQQLIARARLRGDEQQHETRWQTLESLLNLDLGLDKAAATSLLNHIESSLLEVNTDRSQIQQLIHDLELFFGSPEHTARITISTPRYKSLDGQDEPRTHKGNDLLAMLHMGDWWKIERKSGRIPMQLVWQSNPPGRICFVNRSATKKFELALSELAWLHENDKAVPGESLDTPLLERAEYAAIDAIYQGLLNQIGQDQVTKLPNRKHLLMATATLTKPGQESSLCVIRFDPYDLIFSRCGQEAGERLAQELTDHILRRLGKDDRMAVYGDGAFAVLLPNASAEAARVCADSLVRSLQDYRFRHGSESFSVHCFFGIATYRAEADSFDDVLGRAASASNVARLSGPGSIEVHGDASVRMRENESVDRWAGQIDTMLTSDRLFLRCQKILPLQDQDAQAYYEILLGVLDESGQQVGPQSFVLAAERWNRVHELDRWVVDHVFEWVRNSPETFARIGGFSINLSAQSLSSEHLLSVLHDHLAAGDIPGEKIAFEITETATLQNHAAAQDFIRQIRRYGCHFNLDDFGSGQASFGYLRTLRASSLKIDGAYIRDMVEDDVLQTMVRSMNDIGHALGMKTVAEFIGSPELLTLARSMGIDYAQGYEVEEPVHIDNLKRVETF